MCSIRLSPYNNPENNPQKIVNTSQNSSSFHAPSKKILNLPGYRIGKLLKPQYAEYSYDLLVCLVVFEYWQVYVAEIHILSIESASIEFFVKGVEEKKKVFGLAMRLKEQ